jgi:hypothetical protein
MARQLSSIEPEPWYRAVIFYKYSGLHGMPLERYTDRDGRTYEYHRVYVFGPYEKPGTAKSLIKRETGYAKKGYRNYPVYDPQTRKNLQFDVADVDGVIESCLPMWGLHA